MIRLAEPTDLQYLPAIDVAAGAVFRDAGMEAVADDEPPPLALFESHLAEGHLWVWGRRKQAPAAFCLVDVVDGTAHLEQISVDPSHARRGIGAALIDHLDGWARDRGLPEVTLTTFRDVPWSAPYYARLGFTVVADEDLGPGLRAIREAEAERGLDRWPRVVMTRHVPIEAPAPAIPEDREDS
ncbi:acetyltransferase (GNAT) family protein [Rhodococcus sp. OK519]|uniref:GNAT family N-acetyltransferase n=1 Tax=Rhodococcus sp. OK519 TaxID=2135729 RepID=UPI000D3B2471|nr:acetyltransferase (GNAT) family protein [Rhodococcus sp. OK519]